MKETGTLEQYGCRDCKQERLFERRSVCIKHLAYVSLFAICDDFDGGQVFMDKGYRKYFKHERYLSKDVEGDLPKRRITDLPPVRD